MNIRLIASSLVLVSLMAFMPFSVASADGPVIEGPIHLEGTDVLVDCGSFQVLDVYEQTEIFRLFYDQEGNLVKIVSQNWGTDTFTNSVTGKAYPMSFHNNLLVDYSQSPRRSAIVGVIYRLVVPGAGEVFLDVGRIVFERGVGIVFQAGPHQLFDGDFEALCAAME
jgi:hypothetical protein